MIEIWWLAETYTGLFSGSLHFCAVDGFILVMKLVAVFPAMAELLRTLLIALRKSPRLGLSAI